MYKLEAKNLSKEYAKRQVVKNVSLNVTQGEVVGLLGPNGAGKTTCFSIIAGLIAQDNGSVLLDNNDISALPIHLRSKMGISYLPQESSIFRGLSVQDNIMLVLELVESVPEMREKILEEVLAEFSISHLRYTMSTALSGGERRRLEFARAIVSNPKFILLDEPLAGVDPISVYDIKMLIAKLKSKKIGILITDHNVRETLDMVDRAYIIYNGTVLKDGTPDDIINCEQVRKLYLGEDFSL